MNTFFLNFQLAHRHYSNQLHNELAPYGLTSSQWGLIRYLSETGPATFSDLASYWKVEKPSITPIAQKLIEKEIIYIFPGQDKRQKVMHLSEKGVELYGKLKQTIDFFQEEVMDDIPKEDQDIAEQLLDKLLVNLMKRG